MFFLEQWQYQIFLSPTSFCNYSIVSLGHFLEKLLLLSFV